MNLPPPFPHDVGAKAETEHRIRRMIGQDVGLFNELIWAGRIAFHVVSFPVRVVLFVARMGKRDSREAS